MILGSDTFNRTTGTLGVGWTEHGLTNMSCDGSHARVDISSQAHLATLSGTSQRDTYLQCWMLGPGAGNTVGVIWRFQDTSNYYLLRYTTSWGVFRVEGGVATQIGGSFAGDPASIPKRVAVRHVGTRIQVYVDQNYNVVSPPRDGPTYDETDTDAQGQLWTGTAGLSCSAVNAAAISDVKWNDFIVFDGTPETIYVDTTFNGGVVGEGMGTIDRPDLHIDWALNNAGLNKGGKLKFLQDGPITNPTTLQFRIGHGGKFGDTGWSFPTYDPENGSVVSEGAPNLIIEGRDGGRTILREVRSPAETFFRLRDSATGIVCRSLDFELPDTSSRALMTAEAGTSEHSVQFAKCTFTFQDPSGTSDAILVGGAGTGIPLRFECTFCFFDCEPAADQHGSYIDIDDRVQAVLVKFNVFKGLAGTVPGTGAEINYGLQFDTTSDLQAGDTVDIDHNTFIDLFRLFFNEGAIGILDSTNMAGAIEFQNNIVSGPDSAVAPDTMDYGIYTANNTPAGSITAHHNGYFLVTTPRDGGVTNGGNEVDNTDPDYHPAIEGPFTWQHTEGAGLNGEGTSTAIILPRDYRPRSSAYIDTADDSTPNLGILDRGALQTYVPVGGVSIPGLSLPAEQSRIFCPAVIFDPGGPQQYDLSDQVLQMTPVRYERDILLRSYRANDVSIQFNDKNGLFLESNPDSFLLDSEGNPDWMGKPMIVTAVYNGDQIHRFKGFVLEVKALPGTGILQIGNRFQQLFDRHVLANDIVRIVATNNATVHPRTSTEATNAGFHTREGITLHLDVKPTVETLTFDFQDATRFIVTGSVSGHEGEGSIESNFTTLSGSITISGGEQDVVHSGTAITGDADSIVLDAGASSVDDFYNGDQIFLNGGTGAGQVRTIVDYDAISFPFNHIADVDTPWTTIPDSTTTFEIVSGVPTWNQGFHTYVEGEKVTITLGWASSPLENPPETNADRPIVDIYRDFLLSDQAGMLDAADLDQASITVIEGGRGNQMARPFVVDRPERVIEALDDLSLHMGCVTIEKSNATLALASMMPRIVPRGSLDNLCHGDDLMEAETEHLPIYNQFVSVFDYDVATASFLDGVNFPVRRSDNPSQIRYDRLFPAPRVLEFRSFSDEITDNGSWVTLILEVLYKRYRNPALVIKAKAKVRRLAAELDDLYSVDSEVPTTHVDAMEPFAIDKLLTAELTASLELVDVSAIVKEQGECGFLSYDTPGEGYDQCWGYF